MIDWIKTKNSRLLLGIIICLLIIFLIYLPEYGFFRSLLIVISSCTLGTIIGFVFIKYFVEKGN